ncbi:L,D-transpeptidase [Breoghania sp.]|uniref:L,D-transpeptidase n=1 Tax=Breoghania sp. TaxID=2065378 RepID=UPI002605DC05|nr:L,D-transpeptidase [Breoghania sp.]MDJ0931429.1 L,D-transpeptidase [Breoghania sp.]
MRKLLAITAALMIGSLAAASSSAANTKIFDPATKTWMEIGPGAHSGKSPIRKKVVSYYGHQKPGTIIIDTGERRLYYVMDKGRAMKYGIDFGREGFQWAGIKHVARKAEWPGWNPPRQMVAREHRKGRKLPAYMEGGPNNPLGARAMYLGGSLYRIHRSNEPWTIGQAVSSGCIRMANDDVIDLYDRVEAGAKVIIKH